MSGARYVDVVRANQRLTIKAPDALRVLDTHARRKEVGAQVSMAVSVLVASLLTWPFVDSFDEAAGAVVSGSPFVFGIYWCWKRWRERQAENALAARVGASGEITP